MINTPFNHPDYIWLDAVTYPTIKQKPLIQKKLISFRDEDGHNWNLTEDDATFTYLYYICTNCNMLGKHCRNNDDWYRPLISCNQRIMENILK